MLTLLISPGSSVSPPSTVSPFLRLVHAHSDSLPVRCAARTQSSDRRRSSPRFSTSRTSRQTTPSPSWAGTLARQLCPSSRRPSPRLTTSSSTTRRRSTSSSTASSLAETRLSRLRMAQGPRRSRWPTLDTASLRASWTQSTLARRASLRTAVGRRQIQVKAITSPASY